MFVDLDGFKAVNDRYGHPAGDDVLRAVGQRLRRAVRPHDDVARYGGDEFVLLCREASRDAERIIGARIEAALAEMIEWPDGHWYPRASIGTARAQPGDTVASLIERADASMYEIKRDHHAELHPAAPISDSSR